MFHKFFTKNNAASIGNRDVKINSLKKKKMKVHGSFKHMFMSSLIKTQLSKLRLLIIKVVCILMLIIDDICSILWISGLISFPRVVLLLPHARIPRHNDCVDGNDVPLYYDIFVLRC